MPKNVVICCDGTGNDLSGRRTNVVKLFLSLELSEPDRQVAFYDPGVGTPHEPGATNVVARNYRKVTGLAFGRGVFQNVLDGYQFLMDRWEPGDRIFLFGFSRGAYTVRALAAMLHKVGLLHPGSSLTRYALRLFKRYPEDEEDRREHWQEVRRFKKNFARGCKTHFVGVWDTVNSVGAWGTIKSLRPMRALGFSGGTRINFTADNPDILHGRHAVAIDERRTHFRTNLWNKEHSEDHQEVWFPGVHSDVGGGYEEDGLSDGTLEWMLEAAERFGLVLEDGAYDDVNPDPLDTLHNPLLPAWWLAGWRRRRIRAYHPDWPARVHTSAWTRREERALRYHPQIPPEAIEVDD